MGPPRRQRGAPPSRQRSLAARGGSPAAFGGRCIPAGGVAPPLHIPDMCGRRALPAGRLARLGATLHFHHGLLAAVVSLAVLAGACYGNLSPSELRGRRSELNVARGRWSSRGPASYRYQFQYLCFCPASLVTPVEIQVREGRVLAVLDPATGKPAPAAPGRP